MESYSQIGQDLFVLSLIKKGIFLDIGCRLPFELNNTWLLEQNDWTGISIDIEDYSGQWKQRNTSFICADALNFDFKTLDLPVMIDYLSLDIEGKGMRFEALKRIIDAGFEFKIITIEHDAYRIPEEFERIPQRELLTSLGYTLHRADIDNYEDWWINPKYICLQ